jgi:hypothetical protein
MPRFGEMPPELPEQLVAILTSSITVPQPLQRAGSTLAC